MTHGQHSIITPQTDSCPVPTAARTDMASPLRLTLMALCAAALLFPLAVRAQQARDISALITQAQGGAGDEIAQLLPSLKKSHPDKAGVLFLEALLETTAEKAIELYQRVADEHPGSEWGDDALYRLYQYSYAVGAYRTARSYTDRIAKEYPKSPLLTNAGNDATKAAAPPKAKTPAVETAPGSPAKKTPPPAGVKETTPAAGGSFAVQVAAFARKVDAVKHSDELKSMGYTAAVREKTVAGKTVFAVWIGVFADQAAAEAFAKKLKQQQNIDGIVVRR